MPQTSDTMPWTASVESWKYKPQWTAFSGTINHNNWLLLYLIGIDHNSKSNRHKIFSSGKNLHSGSLTCEARVTEKKFILWTKTQKNLNPSNIVLYFWKFHACIQPYMIIFTSNSFHTVYQYMHFCLHLFLISSKFSQRCLCVYGCEKSTGAWESYHLPLPPWRNDSPPYSNNPLPLAL